MKALDVERLAADYSALVRDVLGDSRLQQVRARDRREPDPDIDHVQDYLDPADLIFAALRRQLGNGGWSVGDYADQLSEAMTRARDSGYSILRVLVGCEFSGRVRDAFTAKGHYSMSCDLLPAETPGKHYQGDVRDIVGDGFDLAIYHPPCTYLCASALWRARPEHDKDYPKRKLNGEAALDFVRELMAAPVRQWALENPKGMIGSQIRKADQMIQPYQFGDDASKQTCLWLNDLKPLVADPADYIEPRMVEYRGKMMPRWANQTPCGADRTSPGPDRWRTRSITFQGIANAMADQWGLIQGHC
jgi:hypothetical protein